ncbi:MAG: LbetaH domain-containing protein [Planctomycetota bacterium]|jgi:sugar O-acyltransferase (sialic acid O-acetyltransferase NeuD family)
MFIKVAILGAGSMGRIVQEILETEKSQFKVINYIDFYDNKELWGRKIGNIEVAGGPEILPKLFKKGVHYAALALTEFGHLDKRIRAFRFAEERGFNLLSVISTSAAVSRAAYVGSAVVVCPGAVVMNGTRVEQGTAIETGAIIDHDCFIGEFATICAGAQIGSRVRIEAGAYVGVGSCIASGKQGEPLIIGGNAIVEPGSVVTKNVPSGKTVYGNPAKQRRKKVTRSAPKKKNKSESKSKK